MTVRSAMTKLTSSSSNTTTNTTKRMMMCAFLVLRSSSNDGGSSWKRRRKIGNDDIDDIEYEEVYKEQGGNYRQLRSGKWKDVVVADVGCGSRTNVSFIVLSRREEGYRHR